MMNKPALILVILGVFLANAMKSAAQDPDFSQFYATPLYTNPAMAGTNNCDRGGGRVVANYRNQWPSLPGGFQTTAVSYDQHIDRINSGFGLLVLHDRGIEGLLTTNQIGAHYAYRFELKESKLFLRVGLEGQLIQQGLDWSKIRWEDQIDATRGFVNLPSEPIPPTKITISNFNTGWLLYSKQFYVGLALHNVTRPNRSFYGDVTEGLPRRLTAHAGYVIPLGKKAGFDSMAIRPNVLYMAQGQFSQLNISSYFNLNWFMAGLGHRQVFGKYPSVDAVIFSLGFRGRKWKVGYSYDLTVDSKRIAAIGSHELSASYTWCSKKDMERSRTDFCAAFW